MAPLEVLAQVQPKDWGWMLTRIIHSGGVVIEIHAYQVLNLASLTHATVYRDTLGVFKL